MKALQNTLGMLAVDLAVAQYVQTLVVEVDDVVVRVEVHDWPVVDLQGLRVRGQCLLAGFLVYAEEIDGPGTVGYVVVVCYVRSDCLFTVGLGAFLVYHVTPEMAGYGW